MNVEKNGPLFDGRAKVTAKQMTQVIEDEVAKEALREVTDNMKARFRQPTGYYLSRVKIRPFSNKQRISDGGVIYGHWLEGSGSRNAPETIFPGYRSFRLAKQTMKRKTMPTANRVAKPYIRAMGGK